MKIENAIATRSVLAQAGMKVKSSVKAGGLAQNHNQAIARDSDGLRIKSNVRAGGLVINHNQTIARAA